MAAALSVRSPNLASSFSIATPPPLAAGAVDGELLVTSGPADASGFSILGLNLLGLNNKVGTATSVCRIVVVGATQASSRVIPEPCIAQSSLGSFVENSFGLVGAVGDSYFFYADGVLRRRFLDGGLRWATPTGQILSANVIGNGSVMAKDTNAIYLPVAPTANLITLERRSIESGAQVWAALITFSGPSTVSRPIVLGNRVAVVHTTGSILSAPSGVRVVFVDRESGLGLGASSFSDLGKVRVARQVPGRPEIVLVGEVQTPDRDIRILRIDALGAVISDHILSRVGADTLLGGDVLADGSLVVASLKQTGTLIDGSVQRLRLSGLATQTTILSATPAPVGFLAPITITASVTGSAPTGTIRIDGRRGQFCMIAAPSGSCQISPSTVGPYRLIARYEGDTWNAASVSGSTLVQTIGSSDIEVSFENLPAFFALNQSYSYDVVVRNLGPHRVAGIVIYHAVPAGVEVSGWTCIPTSESFCGDQLSGTGPLDGRPLINNGDALRYRFVVTNRAAQPESAQFTASVAAPDGVTDANQHNNAVTINVFRGIFANSFE